MSDLYGMVTEHKLAIRAKINPILKILKQHRYEVALKYIKISERAAGRKSEIVALDIHSLYLYTKNIKWRLLA